MRTIALLLGLICAGGLVLAPSAASAQATRTWVSGVGDDVNPCSRTAPCKTFAGAISKTAIAGEINCLDPGGFGALTITKSLTIRCEGVEAGVLVSGTNGITVNAAATDIVYLIGLDIEGLGTGLSGISFLQGAALHVEKCLIRGFTIAGIRFAPTGAAKLFVNDTTIAENTGAGAGIHIQPSGAGSAKAALSRVQTENNGAGIRIDGTGSSAGINVTVKESLSSGNAFNGIVAIVPGGGAVTNVMLDHSAFVNNGTNGVKTDGAGATIWMNNVTVTGNTTGLASLNSGQLFSYGNNHIAGNGSAGVAPSVIGQQ
jgi:hypothetical protein